MPFRSAAITIVALLHLFAATDLAEAQRQKGKLGGGAGFAFLKDPEIDLGSTATFGGFLGRRFNDNVSIEGGIYYVSSNRVFNILGEPIDDTGGIPSFRFQTTRYHGDGVVVLNIGRRQPFHPFLLFGAGVERRDDKRTDFTAEADPETGLPILTPEVTFEGTEYLPTGIVGGGADIYFMYNVAARAELRFWIPKAWDERTFALLFQVSYFF